jgi:2-amino-4-hydroxy-6-hydroxymethyldihydropteridine diphosphokinase
MARKEREIANSHLCAIALGSNLGDRLQILETALTKLNDHLQIEVIEVSQWYCSKAVTANISSIQPDYLNGCAILETTLNPEELLEVLLKIEMELGRIRRDRWDARTLDLDLLLYEQKIIATFDLEIPHPRMTERTFVLIPLAEIANDWIHPLTKCSISQLVERLPKLETNRELKIFVKGN